MIKQLSFQIEKGGLIPTSPLQLSSFKVYPATRNEIKSFIEKWHYSQSINGLHVDYCFKMMSGSVMVGAAIFGKLAMYNQWKRFSDKEENVIELRRLCCLDEAPKNSESFFISQMLRWLKKNTQLKIVVSYADAEFGHTGTIYKASNFKLLDFRKGAKVIMWNGKKYHDKAIRTKYKNELKPFAKKLKIALENNEAYYVSTKGKYTYVYNLET